MRDRRIRLLVLGTILFLLATFGGALGGGDAATWSERAPLPDERSEVAGALVGDEIVVVGGFLADGRSSARVDAYEPERDRWRRLPDLPLAVNHAAAASDGRRLFVAGGYGQDRVRLRDAFVLEGRRWRAMPRLPAPRAAAGAAVAGGRLYVVGGVAANGLARTMLVLDLRTRRWREQRGPTPREHLAVVGAGGKVYALGGRRAGIDTNLATFEVYDPARARWRALPPVPSPRGGTGATAVAGRIVSVGGEEPAGAIASVYAYRIARGTWERLPDLRAPRHGLAVVAHRGHVYAVAGGAAPGLTVTAANERLRVG